MRTLKHFLLTAFISLLVLNTNSQTSSSALAESGEKCFDEDTKIINLGIGFLGVNYYNYGRYGNYVYRSYPAFSISYEQAIPKKLGPGFLGLGVYLGYQGSYYQNNDYYYNKNNQNYYYKQSFGNTFIAARAAYHLDALTFEKGEIYFGAVLGLRIQTYRFESNSPDPDVYLYSNQYNHTTIYPGYSFLVGGRYYLSKNVGLFGEFGYGISLFTAGLSIKF